MCPLSGARCLRSRGRGCPLEFFICSLSHWAIGPSHSCLFTSTLSSRLPVPCTSSRDVRDNRFSFLNFTVPAAVAPACADASVWTLTPCPLLVGTVLACLLLHLCSFYTFQRFFFPLSS